MKRKRSRTHQAHPRVEFVNTSSDGEEEGSFCFRKFLLSASLCLGSPHSCFYFRSLFCVVSWHCCCWIQLMMFASNFQLVIFISFFWVSFFICFSSHRYQHIVLSPQWNTECIHRTSNILSVGWGAKVDFQMHIKRSNIDSTEASLLSSIHVRVLSFFFNNASWSCMISI